MFTLFIILMIVLFSWSALTPEKDVPDPLDRKSK